MRAARALSACLLAACSASSACTATTVRSGLPPASSAPMHQDKWHAAFLFGALEASGPYSLRRLCPDGWSEISVGPDPFTVLAGALTLFVYAPTRVTVVCAAKTSEHPPAIGAEEQPTSAEGLGTSSPTPPPPESF